MRPIKTDWQAVDFDFVRIGLMTQQRFLVAVYVLAFVCFEISRLRRRDKDKDEYYD
ncbi:MAG: hypothetical protein O3B01_08050 [Planctomycetota bacterium]|nr:hypothetical protein [Planctomycetota bacterium]MDA1138522.1 hypothetical protein [Planctomycetota bacterium]